MKVIDLFAGCGGFSYGLEQAGFKVIGFVEWWKPAIKTFLKNHPESKLIGTDITKISDETVAQYKGKVDLIVGGPPCQGFSMCGKRDPHDTRNQLYKEFLRFVNIIAPETVVMENVPGLLTMDDGNGRKIIDRIMHDFIKLGYMVSYKVLTASDYDVAQNRKRLIIIGRKKNIFPEPTKRKKTVLEAISDLPEEESSINGHILFETREETIAKFKALKQGEKLCKKFNFCRQRLLADKPSKTVTTNPMFIHPIYDRFLTPRELARLQSFPDNFTFCGSKSSMVKQIGNAVPPLLAQAIAEKLKEVFAYA
ncbi:MAG TPA: DNA cytosine methyltransferase [Candidatus Nanoarchaeia archaeon]|nr:DNA cytosine methyltransferase [Candidatus Nanoarchaeia archaeon]